MRKGFPIPCVITFLLCKDCVCAYVCVPSQNEHGGKTMNSFEESLTDTEKNALSNLIAALAPFRILNPNMPMQYVTALIQVALKQGESVMEYARITGVSESLMSRHLADLGDINRRHEEGLNLIEKSCDPMDRRTQQVKLTKKGQRVVKEMLRALKR
jgi:DNA-binding MarR family transcriptional regulator